jgi:hypothetical protein
VPDAKFTEHGVKRVDLATLLRESDVVSLHVVLTRETRHLMLLSPHMVSSNVGSGLGPGIRWAAESVLHALRGEVPDNVYNKEVIPRWERRFGGQSVWDRKT